MDSYTTPENKYNKKRTTVGARTATDVCTSDNDRRGERDRRHKSDNENDNWMESGNKTTEL